MVLEQYVSTGDANIRRNDMKQVKMFWNRNEQELAKEINIFLKELDNLGVSYDDTIIHYQMHDFKFSALIEYDDGIDSE